MTITRRKALAHIRKNFGEPITVVFVKRSTGEERLMTFRQGVTKHLSGGEPAYDFSEHGLLPVFDEKKKEYRAIPKEGLIRIMIDDEWNEIK